MSVLAHEALGRTMNIAPCSSQMSAAETRPCVLCGSDSTTVAFVTVDQLRQAWKIMGVSFSSAAFGNLLRDEKINLWQCRNCGFEFSHLEHAGNGSFYEELQRQLPQYYHSGSPEFARAIRFARENQLHDVLDVGCGTGAFLDLAENAGLRTYGVELNPEAAASARLKGHVIYDELLETLIARGQHQRFDFVTLWQVLEHVSDPVAFLKQCATFLKASGYLALAVPSENGINALCRGNPHFWPPHHVTRWRLKDLRRVGEQAGLKFLVGGNDSFNPYNARYMWELHNRLAPAFAYSSRKGGSLLPKIIAAAVARVRLGRILPAWGHSTFAFYRIS
jgi:SAM-dependent methyltransferase